MKHLFYKYDFFLNIRRFLGRGGEYGGVFYFIMLGIVLFGALSFAVVKSSDNAPNTLLDEENAAITQAEIDNYKADIKSGIMALDLAGCSSVDYTAPADQIPSTNKSCHLFHPDGAGIPYRDMGNLCLFGVEEFCGCETPAWNSGSCTGNVLYSGSMGNSDSATDAEAFCEAAGNSNNEEGARCCMWHLYGVGEWFLTDGEYSTALGVPCGSSSCRGGSTCFFE